jgi:hypothetical protein
VDTDNPRKMFENMFKWELVYELWGSDVQTIL